jgi:chemotaxis protein histidine kinase CheA
VFDQDFAVLSEDPSIPELLVELVAGLPVEVKDHANPGSCAKSSSAAAETDDTQGTRLEAVENATAKDGPQKAATASVTQAGMPARAPRTRYIRVDAARIDSLCDAIADVTLKVGALKAETGRFTVTSDGSSVWAKMVTLHQRIAAIKGEFDDVAASALALRLVSIRPQLEELADYADSLAKTLGKSVRVEVAANDVEVERNVLDELHEPLMHIVRNAIDHGIEHPSARGEKPTTASVRLGAEVRGASVAISVDDDGAGLDAVAIRKRAIALGLVSRERASLLTDGEAMELVFLDGFTQRETAGAISGRGVGLRAAQSKVESLGGAIRIESSHGLGTRFEILVPSTMSRERVLLVEVSGIRCCIPARWATSVINDPAVVSLAKLKRYLTFRGKVTIVRSVAEWMSVVPGAEGSLILVEIGGRDGGLLVDRVLGEQEILRVSADAMLTLIQRVEASGVLDDGEVVLFLRWAEVLRANLVRRQDDQKATAAGATASTVLVVDDSAVIRDIVSEVLIGAGLRVVTAENGREAERLLGTIDCDLVISDVEMPEMSGLELLERIRSINEMLPVVMLTTRSSPESRRKAASLGANAYIVKSEFRGTVLLEVVRRFLEIPA